MHKYKITATMDVGYSAEIEAESEEEAWEIACNDDFNKFVNGYWEQTDNGHDWTVENIKEIEEENTNG